jgi:phage shock protein B
MIQGWFSCLDPGTIGTLAVLLLFSTPFLAVAGFILIKVLRIVTGNPSRRGWRHQRDDARLMQELHQGLVRMESRIEALEMLLFEREHKEDYR